MSDKHEKIISCDWGTTSLRLAVVNMEDQTVLASIAASQGISLTFALWKQQAKDDKERLSFYQSILSEQIERLEKQLHQNLQQIPLVISGMASSTMGMKELPYTQIPFSADGHDLYTEWIEASESFSHKTLLISGARTSQDVMRGEETQLVGCFNGTKEDDQQFIFPGTHSKHVLVTNGRVVDVKTYMTGEFFSLLCKNSILSNSVEGSGSLHEANHVQAFEKGVDDGLQMNLLNRAFLVRTNDLFERMSKQENYFYLSGLLIGYELRDIDTSLPSVLVGEGPLILCYQAAISKLGGVKLKLREAGEAVASCHCRMYQLHGI